MFCAYVSMHSTGLAMKVQEAFGQLMDARTKDDVARVLDVIAEHTETRYWTFANLGSLVSAQDGIETLCMTNVTDRMVDDYHAAGGAEADPCVRYSVARGNLFRWSDLPDWHEALKQRRGPKKRGSRIMQVAFDHGLRDGTVFPLRSLDQRNQPVQALVTLHSDQDLTAIRAYPEFMRWTHTLLYAANVRISEIHQPLTTEPVYQNDLTDREAEVLRWAARGKTVEETGDILKISDRTVEKHIGNAMDKIGAANKTHAVALVLSWGLIVL